LNTFDAPQCVPAKFDDQINTNFAFGGFGTAAGARGAACGLRNFKKMAQGQPWNWSESENVLKNWRARTI
jgi:hypothetical protein